MNSPKRRLLFIVEAMGGGVFSYIVDLTRELCDSYDLYLAYSIRPQTPFDYKSFFDDRVHLIRVNSFTRSISPVNDFKAFFEIREIAKRVHPDIIHLHSSKAGVIGRLAFNGKNAPLYYTPHGYSFLMEDTGRLRRALYMAIESICARRNCTTISCSYGEHIESLKLTKKAAYVSNGINTSELNEVINKTKKIDHPITVYTCGRICYQKNPELFNIIAESLPQYRFIWIGDGELRHVLTASNVEITGWIERNDAISMSVNADVFLLTSRWEGLSVGLLEAMYMKKLCVVSDVIGNHDVIRNGENGFVCKVLEEYKKRIMSTDVDQMIDMAHDDVLKKYNARVMSNGYMQIYGMKDE